MSFLLSVKWHFCGFDSFIWSLMAQVLNWVIIHNFWQSYNSTLMYYGRHWCWRTASWTPSYTPSGYWLSILDASKNTFHQGSGVPEGTGSFPFGGLIESLNTCKLISNIISDQDEVDGAQEEEIELDERASHVEDGVERGWISELPALEMPSGLGGIFEPGNSKYVIHQNCLA